MFQIEKQAKYLCALASKTYICVGLDDKVKISSKGLNKSALADKDAYKMFTSVLSTGVSQGSTNVGFRVIKDKVYTYNCYRDAIPYFYIKRKCFTPCGIFTTAYRDLVLEPVPKPYFCVYTDGFCLSLDHQHEIKVHKYKFQTLRQAHCYLKYMDAIQSSTARNVRKKMTMQKRQQLFTSIMLNTDPLALSKIEKSLEASDEFYASEFDTIYNLVGLKINAYPDMLQALAKAGKAYIANTCYLNSRLGTGVGPGRARYQERAFLSGGNLLGMVLMTYAVMTKTTLRF